MRTEPLADRSQAMLAMRDADTKWPGALVVGSDAHAGRRYACLCGWEGWTAFGHAWRHRRTCITALGGDVDLLLRQRAALVSALEAIADGDGKDAALARAALSRWTA